MPKKRCLPASASAILNSLVMGYNDQYHVRQLPRITGELKQAARDSLPIVEESLVPARPEFIKGATVASMLHFYVAELPPAVSDAIAGQWVKCLAEYPPWAVDDAFIAYLKNNPKRKPTPGDINDICKRLVSKARALRMLCNRIIDAPLYEEEPEETPEDRDASKKRVSDMVAAVKRNLQSV